LVAPTRAMPCAWCCTPSHVGVPLLTICLILAHEAAAEPAKLAGHSGVKGHDIFSAGGSWPERHLQNIAGDPTIDEVDSVIFSRPPLSKEETSITVYYAVAGIYVLSVIVLLVAFNLDQSERRKRRERAIVPEESVPCAIAEQYYLDENLVAMRSSQDFGARKQQMGFGSYILHFGALLPDALTRQHLALSLVVRAIPTFTRLKRGLLIVVHLHLCMLTASLAYNVLEHEKPKGKYEMLSCDGGLADSSCTATLPLSIIAALVSFPVFRFVAVRQMRLTCFGSQSHPSHSRFPLHVRKFAAIPAKSPWESFFCMRNAYERRQTQVLGSRSFASRAVNLLWRTTQPSIKDLRYYSKFTSCCILLVMVLFMGVTLAYIILYTAYLKDDVVYHWCAWVGTMFFGSIVVLEPLQIITVEVFWCSAVAALAQRWGFGAHALASTTRYKDVVRQIEILFIKGLRIEAANRITRWWQAVLDMYKAINEQTAAAIKIQAIRKKMMHQKKYIKERKWCMKIEVLDCFDLNQVTLNDIMSPFVRLKCDIENPTVMQTKVSWETHTRGTYNETFFVDVKDSHAMFVSVWSKAFNGEEFVGRGYFEFSQLKNTEKDKAEGHVLKVALYNIQHGEKRPRNPEAKATGYVSVRVRFLDPLKEPIGGSEEEATDWMLPKHRMQFALSQMGGRVRVSKMLGGYGIQATPAETGQSWQVPKGTTTTSDFMRSHVGMAPTTAVDTSSYQPPPGYFTSNVPSNVPRGVQRPSEGSHGTQFHTSAPTDVAAERASLVRNAMGGLGEGSADQPSASAVRTSGAFGVGEAPSSNARKAPGADDPQMKSSRSAMGMGFAAAGASKGDSPPGSSPPPGPVLSNIPRGGAAAESSPFGAPPSQPPAAPPPANMSLTSSPPAGPPPGAGMSNVPRGAAPSSGLPGAMPENDGDDEIDPLTGLPFEY